MKNILSMLTTMLICSMIGNGVAAPYNESTLQLRSADTCADPSLTVTYISIYDPSIVAHALSSRPAFISQDPAQGSWGVDGEAFLAWASAQEFTNALYQFHDTATTTDYLYAVSTDGNAPSVPGFTADSIIGYVYDSQVCGSVPLLGVFNQAAGDHYYTTIANEHSQLVNAGPAWVDTGILAYVLPL